MPTYEVKNVKSFRGMEGYGFECSLYKAGKRIVDIPSESSGDFTPEREEAGVVQGRMGGIGFEEKDDAWSDLNPYWNK